MDIVVARCAPFLLHHIFFWFCVGILLIATAHVPGPGPVAADLSEAATSSLALALLLPWQPVTPLPLTATGTEAGPVTGVEADSYR